VAATLTPPADSSVRRGVPAIRAGQGHQFFWRRLHSLSGIVPVGAFLFEHILISNSTALNGPQAYADQVKFLGSLPLVVAVEAIFIWIPILFHGGYGIYIWLRGQSNVADYPWTGNWMYTLQRYTGLIAFAYIGWHVWHLRFAGIDLHAYPGSAFGKVQMEMFVPWQFTFYVVGLIAACWHFAYGIYLFCAKWGFVPGETARKRVLVACVLFFILISGVGLASITKFRSTPRQPVGPAAEELRTQPAPSTKPLTGK
jgi:succinate dehydrogenase / fumarate reductase cytochrome b subunit